MNYKSVLMICALLFVVPNVNGDIGNVALFWNLYDAVVQGGRILHDVTEGVGAVSKAIKAIDSFLDSTAEKQIKEALEEAQDEELETQIESPSNAEEVNDPEEEVNNRKKVEEIVHEENVPKFTGCGALGFHIRDEQLVVPVTKLTQCCGVHDTCYNSACRVNKRDCDGKLRNCLFSVCDDKKMDKSQQRSCRGAAKLLFSGTMALSFQQYNDAQAKLMCQRKGGKDKRRR